MRVRNLTAIFFVLMLACSLAFGQETTGSITGFVKDKTGAVVPDVKVVIRNSGTGAERTVITSSEGEYSTTLLPIGKYEVSIEAAGFKKFLAKNINLSVNDRLRVDADLEVGAAGETIVVEAVTQQVQTESSAIGSVITGTQVTQIPLNGRSLYQLVALQPGVSATGAIASGRVGVGLDNLASVNVNGTRAAQNNWLIDGADNVDTGSNLATINYISVDSVSEFRILRGNYNAEFGRSGGGQINVVTKGGTNEFHGGAFEFWRNDAMDAVKPLLRLDRNADGNFDQQMLRYHNFGYNIGGPIKKDTLHFYFGQEYRKVRTERGTGTTQTRVPTALQRGGNFSELLALATPVYLRDPLLTGACSAADQTACFPGNIIPANRLDSNSLALLDLWPAPNTTGLSGNRNYVAATPSGRNYREELYRVDYNLNSAHKFFVRYLNDHIPSTEPFGEIFGTAQAALPDVSNTATTIGGRNLVADHTWLISNSMVNNFAYNYSRGSIISNITGRGIRDNFSNFQGNELYATTLGNVLPGISFGGSQNYGGFDFFGPYNNTYGSHRWKDTLSWTTGSHTFKFGYLYSTEFKNENNGSGLNGAFVFPGTSSGSVVSANDAFADFLLGRASSYTEKDVDITSHLRYNMHEAFAQDDWKILPNLTLNLGVRWSAILPPTDTGNVLTNFIPELFDPSAAYDIGTNNRRVCPVGRTCDPLNGLVSAGVNSPYGDRIVETHWNTFGPRVGFAWDPFSTGKTSVRGGYGIYYDRTLSGIALQNAFINPPFVTAATYSATTTGFPTFANPANGAAADTASAVPALISMSPNFKVPTTQHWSLGIQRELFWGMTTDVTYAGNHGTHLLRAVRINQGVAGSAPSGVPTNSVLPYRGWGSITERQTSASSRYDSLQVSLNKRQSTNLSYGLAYTWSKVMTDSPDDRTTLPQDSYNLDAEHARASFDKAHIFVGHFMYDLPQLSGAHPVVRYIFGGYQFGGIVRLETGAPLTITTGTSTQNAPNSGALRPNLVGDPKGPEIRLKWFNTAAFATPAANTFGNAGRSLVDGPGIMLTDLSLYKNLRITERFKMQLRGEFFNALNHTNYSGVSTAMNASNFGQVTSVLDPRQIQLGAKLTF